MGFFTREEGICFIKSLITWRRPIVSMGSGLTDAWTTGKVKPFGQKDNGGDGRERVFNARSLGAYANISGTVMRARKRWLRRLTSYGVRWNGPGI